MVTNELVLSPHSMWCDCRLVMNLVIFNVTRYHSVNFVIHSQSSYSDAGNGLIHCPLQSWTNLFLGVVYVYLVREQTFCKRYSAGFGGRLQCVYQVSGM
jgi:hypothetical protein